MSSRREIRLGFLLSVAGTAAVMAGCGSQNEPDPAAEGSSGASCVGGSSSSGGSTGTGGSPATGGSSTSGSNGTGGNWGGRSTGGSAGDMTCNTLANIGTEVHPVADPAPVPEMTGGTIVDGTYVLASIVNYDGASADPTMVKQTMLITENGLTAQQVASFDGGPDLRRTLTHAPSGNELNATETCPEQASTNRIPYTATPNSFTVFVEPVGSNMVVTFTRPDCVGPVDNHFCAPEGFPFVKRAFAVSESCPGDDCHPPNPNLTQPESGTLCMSGTATADGHALRLPLYVGNQDGSEVVRAFDADALGITQISFTIDSPPASGISVNAPNIAPKDCTGDIFACLARGFTLPLITEPGKTTVPLVDFMQEDAASAYQTFDASSMSGIGFEVGEGPYDFCVRNFAFLDAFGDEVNP